MSSHREVRLLGVLILLCLSTLRGAKAQEPLPTVLWNGTVGGSAVTIVGKPEPGIAPNPYFGRIQQGMSNVDVYLLQLAETPNVRVWNDRRVVLWTDTYGVVLDVPTATKIDTFTASGVFPSPNARYLAFSPVYSRLAESRPDIYLIYDVSGTAVSNRLEPRLGPGEAQPYLAGWPVYPTFNRASRTYSTEADAPHQRASPLQWLDDNHLAFVDRADPSGAPQSLSVVLVDLTNGAPSAEVRSVPLDISAALIPNSEPEGSRPLDRVWIDSIGATEWINGYPALRIRVKAVPSVTNAATIDVAF